MLSGALRKLKYIYDTAKLKIKSTTFNNALNNIIQVYTVIPCPFKYKAETFMNTFFIWIKQNKSILAFGLSYLYYSCTAVVLYKIYSHEIEKKNTEKSVVPIPKTCCVILFYHTSYCLSFLVFSATFNFTDAADFWV